MIKNSSPELETFLLSGGSEKSAELLTQLGAAGVPFIEEGNELKLAEEVDILSPSVILEHAGEYCREEVLEVYRSIGSTNDAAMQQLTVSDEVVCVAETQLAGKGRRGRNWVSPFGCNIYLSIGRYLRCNISELEGLSLVVGMAAVEVLRHMGLDDIGLKWPNDLLLDGGKVGGILVEMRAPADDSVALVIGLGINLAMTETEAVTIDQSWSQVGGRMRISRSALVGNLIRHISAAVTKFEQVGFAAAAEFWPDYNIYMGEEVRIIRGDEIFEGIDQGVDERGNLLLLNDGELTAHNAGEVSLRPVRRR
jgi:BirA family biotin operon repressor/biotin-[acetyl-CoA-carboxylase] ligase